MKKTLIFLSAFLLLAFANLTFAQLPQIGPSIQIGASAGYAKYNTDLISGGLELSSSARYGVVAHLSLPILPINFVGYYFYAPLNTSNDLGTSGNYEYSSSLSNIGLGIELPLIPGPIKPYLAADYLITRFGESTFTATPAAGSPSVTNSPSKSRSGIAFGTGLRFTLFPVIDIDATVKYNMNNLFGKDSGEDTINSTTVMATIFVGL